MALVLRRANRWGGPPRRSGHSLLAFAGLAAAQGLSDADREFVKKAAHGGLAEVELGNLATQRASRPIVKEFGARW